MVIKLPTWFEERNTEGFKSWLIANHIDIGFVPEDAEISVVDGVIHYERYRWDPQRGPIRDPETNKPLRETAWVIEIVPRGVA